MNYKWTTYSLCSNYKHNYLRYRRLQLHDVPAFLPSLLTSPNFLGHPTWPAAIELNYNLIIVCTAINYNISWKSSKHGNNHKTTAAVKRRRIQETPRAANYDCRQSVISQNTHCKPRSACTLSVLMCFSIITIAFAFWMHFVNIFILTVCTFGRSDLHFWSK